MSQQQDPLIALSLPLGSVNFILDALNRNPAQAPVMQVAALISSVQEQATKTLEPVPAQESKRTPEEGNAPD